MKTRKQIKQERDAAWEVMDQQYNEAMRLAMRLKFPLGTCGNLVPGKSGVRCTKPKDHEGACAWLGEGTATGVVAMQEVRYQLEVAYDDTRASDEWPYTAQLRGTSTQGHGDSPMDAVKDLSRRFCILERLAEAVAQAHADLTES